MLRDLGGAKADDEGWPIFNGKYVEYPRFRREWVGLQEDYLRSHETELVCCTLQEKCLSTTVKALMGDMEELDDEVWQKLNKCFNRPEKYITKTLEPINKF